MARDQLPERIIHALEQVGETEVVGRPIPLLRRLYGNAAFRRLFTVVVLAVIWQTYGRILDNPLMFPTLTDTLAALWDGLVSGKILLRVAISLQTLLVGYAMGIALAALLTGLAMTSLMGASLLETLTAMFNPLPSIALLPLALLWFGLGDGSLLFVLLHAVMWVVAMNTYAGFLGVSQTLRMVGQNYGLGRTAYILRILVPAAFPSILSGLKIGWAFAWRTLVAAELVFGVSSGRGGLGWFIYENKNVLQIPSVFAGLLMVILIGLLVDSMLFRVVERHTIQKWGMVGR
jgi:NitT/TauT family transport system permease protein